MKLTQPQFEKEIASLNEKIRDHFKKYEESGRELIPDGIVNVDRYYKAPVRILWILKEPYCNKNNGGGGWSLSQGLLERAAGNKKDSHTTWHPIIYTSCGILKNLKFEQMPKIAQDKSMNYILKEIAVINVQKLPARTRTNDATLKKSFEINKSVLLEQINTYRPHVVIGGKTLHLFREALQVTKDEELEYGHFKKDKRLFIQTTHPAQTKVTRKEYVNAIIERAQTWEHLYA